MGLRGGLTGLESTRCLLSLDGVWSKRVEADDTRDSLQHIGD